MDLTSLTKFLPALNNSMDRVSNIGTELTNPKNRSMKKTKSIFLLLFFSALLPVIASAQARTMSFDASTSLMLQEFSAMLTFEEDQVKVAMRIGRDEAKAGEDRLEQGDVIVMMNGTRAKDISSLREVYDALEDDTEIKIGVQRGEERFIVRAMKGDAPEGGGMRMVMELDDEGDSDGAAPVIVGSLGLILTDKDAGVVVDRVIDPLLPEVLKELDIQGYTISEINGEKPESADAALRTINALAVGDEISMIFTTDGDEKEIKFKKPEANSNFSISGGNE